MLIQCPNNNRPRQDNPEVDGSSQSNPRQSRPVEGKNVYLHFMLVVEVIKLNRIIDQFMTLDWDVQQIYGLAQIS